MNWTVVQRILGLLLMIFSLTMLPPIGFSLYYDDHSWLPFVEGFGITLAAGLLILLGLFLLVDNLGWLSSGIFWALALIGAGLFLIVRRSQS